MANLDETLTKGDVVGMLNKVTGADNYPVVSSVLQNQAVNGEGDKDSLEIGDVNGDRLVQSIIKHSTINLQDLK